MRLLLVVVCAVLVVLSLVVRMMVRQGREDHWFVSSVMMANILFAFIGLFLVALANASLTNPFAKYQEGFPHVEAGGLSGPEFVINLIFFLLPLFAAGIGRILKEIARDFEVIFSDKA
ncbi:MAG: hypothetical protein AAB641_00215 [Patescibacteria group bacterium]